ncbi:hypothetical protein OVW21_26935, partial [Klebsiella pneumoniae]|uniref:hypothetical protein n=1 Tax=Klebsiella pneumoniae TaxID=573 RepID=UPI0022716047
SGSPGNGLGTVPLAECRSTGGRLMPVSILVILAAVVILLAILSLVPAANSFPLLQVAVLLLGIGLLVIGYKG